jgi:hypothetical protein
MNRVKKWKKALLVGFNLGLGILALDSTALAQGKKIPIEFETLSTINNISPADVAPSTFYYSNADDNPAELPTIGENQGVKFIETKSIRGDSKGVKSTVSSLNRWVKIPPNPPEKIKISFKTRVEKNSYYDWTMPSQTGMVRRTLRLKINFLREDGLKGGGINLSTDQLRETLNQWQSHEEILKIPKGAKYIHINLETSAGYNLALGDWRIE